MVALLGLAMAVALTMPENGNRLGSVAACLPDDLGDVATAAGRVGVGLESLLNVAMLMPFALAAVLATRRVAWPALVVVVLPAVIELVQTQVPGRQCSVGDYLANTLGGLIAVAAGALLQRYPRVRAWLDEHEPAWPVRRVSARRP
jgi:glycopeptide antibiotics resistance protein